MYSWRLRSTVFTTAVAGLVWAAALGATAQNPDNTKNNTRDRQKGAVTADQQKENAADREITQKIRQAIVRDKTLSTYAHNVKVITTGGQVTLKGPVRTEDEKRTIESLATDIAGAGRVTNQIDIAPAKKSSR